MLVQHANDFALELANLVANRNGVAHVVAKNLQKGAQNGVPIRGFRVATNQNDILYRLFTTGEYRIGEVHPSLAPSMDIPVASNFERFIYYAVGGDPGEVREVMQTFKATGAYTFPNFDRDTFAASRTRTCLEKLPRNDSVEPVLHPPRSNPLGAIRKIVLAPE